MPADRVVDDARRPKPRQEGERAERDETVFLKEAERTAERTHEGERGGAKTSAECQIRWTPSAARPSVRACAGLGARAMVGSSPPAFEGGAIVVSLWRGNGAARVGGEGGGVQGVLVSRDRPRQIQNRHGPSHSG